MAVLHLVEGPAGGGKSQHVREMLAAGVVSLVADVTRLWAALGGHERDPETGRYPIREDGDPALALALYIQTAAVRQALAEGQDVVVTASTRSAESKWRAVVESLDDATMSITTVDPGRAVVIARLATADDPLALKEACARAVDRWYSSSRTRTLLNRMSA